MEEVIRKENHPARKERRRGVIRGCEVRASSRRLLRCILPGSGCLRASADWFKMSEIPET